MNTIQSSTLLITMACTFSSIFSHAAEVSIIRDFTSVAAEKSAQKQQTEKKSSDKNKTEKLEKKEKEPPMTEEQKGDWINQTLDFGVDEDRIKAINRIQLLKDSAQKSKIITKLINLMEEEENPEVLVKAITILGEMKETESTRLLSDKIDHSNEDVRIAAVYGLKSLNATSAKDKLIQKLKEQNLENNSNFIIALINTLGDFKALEMVPFAKEALENVKTHKGIKESLVLYLGSVKPAEAKDLLLKLYKDEGEDVTTRSYAVNSLSKLGIKDVASDIKQVIKNIDALEIKKRKQYNTLYLYSIAALARLGDEEAVPKLINALRSNNSQIRLKAISLIKDFKDKRTIDILKYKMKYDQNDKVRKAAQKALEEMGVDIKDEKQKKE